MVEQARTHHAERHRLEGAFGSDPFGRAAERFARWFGTPAFLIGQTLVVVAWVVVNAAAAALRWDPYPFILLNLGFSLQAAYAAPLILLAQTRQADRDKLEAEADQRHRDEQARETLAREQSLQELLAANTRLTHEIDDLVHEIRARLDRGS